MTSFIFKILKNNYFIKVYIKYSTKLIFGKFKKYLKTTSGINSLTLDGAP